MRFDAERQGLFRRSHEAGRILSGDGPDPFASAANAAAPGRWPTFFAQQGTTVLNQERYRQFALLLAVTVGWLAHTAPAAAVVTPLARYNFDDATANDSFGGLHGTLNGPATIVNDVTRGSMVLNLTGTDSNENSSFVAIADPMGKLNFGPADSRSATLAAWVFMNASVNHNTIFSQGEWRNGLSLTVKGDTATSPGPGGTPPTTVDDLLWVGEPAVFSSAPVPIQQWTHVAATFAPNGTNTDVAYYVNGVARGSGQMGNVEAPVNGSAIGREWRNATVGDIRWIWGGRIDDLMIFESALDSAGVIDAMNGNVTTPVSDVLELQVNAVSGAVTMRNTTASPIAISAYRITSDGQSLDTSGWDPIATGVPVDGFPQGNGNGNGWELAPNASAKELEEWFLTSSSTIAATNGSVSLGSASFPTVNVGDHDNNGIVDTADYVLWRKNGLDQTQYNNWRSNFGKRKGTQDLFFQYTLGDGTVKTGTVVYVTSGSSAAVSAVFVPEPATAALLLVAVLFGVLRRGPRQRI